MYDLVVKGGLLVNPTGSFLGTIAVREGKIVAVAMDSEKLQAGEVIDASGKLVFPGMIDCHIHFNDPGFEWREDFIHGSQSAAAGGVTTVIDMPLQNIPPVTTAAAFDAKIAHLKDRSVVDYALWGGLVDNNIEEMEGLYQKGVVALKAFLSPTTPEYSMVTIGLLREALKSAAQIGIIIGIHCEDASILTHEEQKAQKENRCNVEDFLASRPPAAELLAVESVLRLMEETGARVHICHVSHPEVAARIKQAQDSGLPVTAETCPHYLVFSAESLKEKGPLLKCAPPLRSRQDVANLWSYLVNGTISCIASDHSPCTLEEKEIGASNIWQAWGGISGVQTTFQIMFNEMVHKRNLKPECLATVFSYNPAITFGLYPRKGNLYPGADADLVIVDPHYSWEITPDELFYKNKISAFAGMRGKGIIEQTLVRGQTVYARGQLKAKPGYGAFISPLRPSI
ncbi:allantoinase AllB [Moorella sulfitireducens (nom. illeg.)]|uniref:allantoinase AllB n=1 Tax=Neomoorella sulfitireducens TaxID=2972948 RepID=UPI0021ACED7F|nr:allantoinase AllB [Moorella sulfitireducens]